MLDRIVGLSPVTAALEEGREESLRRPGPIRRGTHDLRPRARDRRFRSGGVLVAGRHPSLRNRRKSNSRSRRASSADPVKKLALGNEEQSQAILRELDGAAWSVGSVKKQGA